MGTDSYFLMMILSHAIKNKLLYEMSLIVEGRLICYCIEQIRIFIHWVFFFEGLEHKWRNSTGRKLQL